MDRIQSVAEQVLNKFAKVVEGLTATERRAVADRVRIGIGAHVPFEGAGLFDPKAFHPDDTLPTEPVAPSPKPDEAQGQAKPNAGFAIKPPELSGGQ